MIYLIWLCVCLGLVIIGLMIDRTWLNKKIKKANKENIDNDNYYVDRANDYRTMWVNSEVRVNEILDELKETNDLLDQYILRDFERCRKKMIVKRKKKK